MPLLASLWFALALAQTGPVNTPADIVLTRPLNAKDGDFANVMAHVAERAAVLDPETDPPTRLANAIRLELAMGRFTEAARAAAELDANATARHRPPAASKFVNMRWILYARAKALAATHRETFAKAFSEMTGRTFRGLDGQDAYALEYSFDTSLGFLQENFDSILQRDAGASALSVKEAIALVGAYETLRAYREFQPLAHQLSAEDEARRYVVNADVQVATPDGAIVCALVVRPRDVKRLPALLNFTIYDDPHIKQDDARRTAANGYAAVIGFTRGKGCSPQEPVPLLHDGADADAVIEWISRQSWSDGRVGMFGGSYEGFTQWAAAKHPPKALKAIMPSVSFSPGVDFPMDGGVFLTYGLPWPLYTTDNKYLDDSVYFDAGRWEKLQHQWYVSGRAYRDLDQMAGVNNPVWEEWLAHPAYDSFWRDRKPSSAELANLDIPVLTTTGYYDSGQSGALSYWTRYSSANPSAQHYLVIGPWDHHAAQFGTISPLGTKTSSTLRGIRLDDAGQFDIIGLRYQWFDWIFGRGPKPAILQAPVNFEVMGENRWAHAPSVAAMGVPRRYYLRSPETPDGRALLGQPDQATAVLQSVDFKDRSDADRFAPNGPLIDQALDDWPIVTRGSGLANSVVFETKPLDQATEVSGLFSTDLDLTANKRDLDVAVTLFDLTPQGEWIQLSYDWQRASYAEDPSRRELLTPGRRTHLRLTARRTTSRVLAKGDRLAVVIGVIKQPGEEINYGTGRPVTEETVADAGDPLQVRWWGDSSVDVPIGNRPKP